MLKLTSLGKATAVMLALVNNALASNWDGNQGVAVFACPQRAIRQILDEGVNGATPLFQLERTCRAEGR